MKPTRRPLTGWPSSAWNGFKPLLKGRTERFCQPNGLRPGEWLSGQIRMIVVEKDPLI